MRKIISLICLLLPVLAFAAQPNDAPQLRSDAPDKHVVVKGDTLWDISAKFFKDPWKWQYIWGMNKDAIKDPHWIYPGDVIYLDRINGTLRIGQPPSSSSAPSDLNVVRLSPRTREGRSSHDAVPTIPADAIAPFLSQPLIVENGALTDAPTLIGAREGRVMLGMGDTGFVKNLPSGKGNKWQLFRPGKTLTDPDTKEVLGIEATYLGRAEATDFAEVSTVTITESAQEIGINDRLVLPSDETVNSYLPRAPEGNIAARVISVYGGVSQGGQNTVITLNKGKRDGLEVGHVLALYHKGENVKHEGKSFTLPDERYGLTFVFRVFDKVSYALVMQTRLPVQLLDRAQTPEMQPDPSLKAWLALSLTKGLGGEGARGLLRAYGSPEAVFTASSSSLKSFVKPEVAAEISRGIADEPVAPALTWLEDDNNHIVTLADADYPQALLNIPDPPLLLYVKGRLDLLNRPALAVVGSRNATPQGLNNAEAFSRTLSEAGLCIVSGLAHGVDAAAHRGALKGSGSSIAVVGTGLDRIYPAANRDLAHALATDGTIVSEFPLGMPPLAANFPRRNRIISGLAVGTLVVEASVQSGSLITARLALEQGRDVFAIPGSIHAPQSKGCHRLIKQGAKLVEAAQDILEELGGLTMPAVSTETSAATDIEPALLIHMGFDPVDLDTLIALSGLTMAELSAMLLTLELDGRISALPGGLYQRLN